MEVYPRSNGGQELRFCIRSGISQAANGVHSAVVLYGLVFVSSDRAEPHCSQPSAADLFAPQAKWLTLSCSDRGGRYSKRRIVLPKLFRKDKASLFKTRGTTATTNLVLHGESLVNFKTKVKYVLKGILLPSMFAELQSTRLRRDEVPTAITSVLSALNMSLQLFIRDKAFSIHV